MNWFRRLLRRESRRISNTTWFTNLAFAEYTELFIDNVFKYNFEDVGQVEEGVSYHITGYLLLDCERFTIDFLNKESHDIALHINPRIPHNYVIRSCRINNIWHEVEVPSSLPFILRRGNSFTMEIFITEECFMISINGQHFAEFKHRFPYKKVNYIEVKGDIQNVDMIRRLVKTYPIRAEQAYRRIRVDTSFIRGALSDFGFQDMNTDNIPDEFKIIRKHCDQRSTRHTLNAVFGLPYYGRLDPNLTVGCCLKIEGRVRVLPHSFSINLQQGHYIWPRANVAFRFSPHYLEKFEAAAYQQVVVCNSFFDGKWSSDLRFDIYKEFQPGRTFSLAIFCSTHCFEVYVNRRWLMDFKHRVQPDIVNMLYIEGDIKIWDVVLDTREWSTTKRQSFMRPDFGPY